MADRHVNRWFVAAFGVVIVMLGAALWKVTQSSDAAITKRLAAIDSKIESANAALANAQTASTAVAIKNRLDHLDAKIANIAAALTDIRKGASLDTVGGRLDTIGTGLKNITAALADLQKNPAAEQVSGKIDQLGASIQSADGKLAAIKQAIPSSAAVEQFANVTTQIKSINATLAKIEAATVQAGAGGSDAIENAVNDLKKNIDEAASLRTKLADEIGRLEEAIKSAAKPKPSEVVVVYLDMPHDAPMPQTTATVSPLRIQFKEVGSADDDGQAAMIVAKLRDIVKDRKDCTISVAGYADTLGGDKTNLALSKKRARVIAEKLKAAFAGKPVQINESAWGERRLANWTPDEIGRETNRRVDVAVSCKE
jgi:outer membrane protein OmpA-like peptidoglycan-associated protein